MKHLGTGVSRLLGPVWKPIVGAGRYGVMGVATGFNEGVGDLVGYMGEGAYSWGLYFLDKWN